MKTYSSEALAALAAGRITKRRLVLFSLGSGDYGFWDGMAPFTPSGANVDAFADGKTFLAGGSLIAIERGSVDINGTAPEITMQLRSVPNTDLTPDVLATILTEDYHRKPVYIFRGLFDVDGAVIEIALRDRGSLDSVSYVEDPDSGTAMIEAKVESKLIDWNRGGAHDRNDESQRATFPDDKGLGNIERATQVKKWGKGVSQ
jgi:hypothetical protein